MKRLSAINPGQDQRSKDQGGERIGTEANPPNSPVAIATPMVQNDKGGIEKGREKRSQENAAKTEDRDMTDTVQVNMAFNEIADRTGSYERFQAVTNEPAKNHCRRYITLELDQTVSGKCRQKHNPPPAARSEKEGGQENRVRWPKDRNRMWLKGEGKSEFCSEKVTGKNQESPVEQLAEA